MRASTAGGAGLIPDKQWVTERVCKHDSVLGAAALADADEVAGAQQLVERGGAPADHSALEFDLSLNGTEIARRRKARVLRESRHRRQHRHPGKHECGEKQPDTHPPSVTIPSRLSALGMPVPHHVRNKRLFC